MSEKRRRTTASELQSSPLVPYSKNQAADNARRRSRVAKNNGRRGFIRWRKDGTALIKYLLDSEVHTFAFSVAANAILSFIPFTVLLYTLCFHSEAMKSVVTDMVNYFLPSVASKDWIANHLQGVAQARACSFSRC